MHFLEDQGGYPFGGCPALLPSRLLELRGRWIFKLFQFTIRPLIASELIHDFKYNLLEAIYDCDGIPTVNPNPFNTSQS